MLPYVTWEVTENCNHNCIHCYNYWDDKCHNALNSECMDEICGFIINHNPTDVTLTGGEPFLIFENLKKYINAFSEKGISLRINCNGSLLNDENLDYCALKNVRLMISFPSSKCTIFSSIVGNYSSYHKVIDGIKAALAKKIPVIPNIVVSSLNLFDVYDTCVFLKEKFDIDDLFISRATKPINADDNFLRFQLTNDQLDYLFDTCLKIKDEMKINVRSCGTYPFCSFNSQRIFNIFSKGCGAGKNSYVISNSGDIRACVRDDTVYGNIFDEGFSLEKTFNKMAEWRNDETIPKDCQNCNVVSICRGGCRTSNKSLKGSLNERDCNMRLERTPVFYDLSQRGHEYIKSKSKQ